MKHVAADPGWTSLFSHIPTAAHAPAESMTPQLNARFESQLHGLKGELMREVADEANSLITTTSAPAAATAERGDATT